MFVDELIVDERIRPSGAVIVSNALVPSMMALLGFVYLIPLVVTGPLLNDMWFLKEQPCDVHWWRIPTMTHNYMSDLSNMCLPHFWYVSADFQLAIVTTVILVVIVSRFPKLGIAIMAAIVFSTSLALGIVTHLYNYMPLSLGFSLQSSSATWPLEPHRLSIKAQAFWWTVAVVFACSSLFGAYSWNRGREPQRLESDIYAALHRFAWGFAVSWVMRKGQEHIGVTITAYALATIPYLCIECPIAVLDNLVFGWAKEGEPRDSAETTKQNKAHELEGFQWAAASKDSQSHGVPRTNSEDMSPTRGANHDTDAPSVSDRTLTFVLAV
ncbi:hypothetical protein HPB47_004212 [Ixodes persulcatus]|uniref:Uncharacterized protein n=1 Tax=Ixodes persulcatus TaxID=34615 RepID=A0AC60PGA6_IXOPE|nr:hypothetical protein HPB47_004212 [Ixodes persulcatus]